MTDRKQTVPHPTGEYAFLPGIDPYSCGVIAAPGWEIVHATLDRPLPWHHGMLSIRSYLETIGRHRHALCGAELRCPAPYSMGDFIAFNTKYRALLDDWEMILDNVNPLARTNVAPVTNPPTEPMIHGFSYTSPNQNSPPTFVVAGAGELREGALDSQGIVRRGETCADAMQEKAKYVVEVMRERQQGLGAADESLTVIDVYTEHPLQHILSDVIKPVLPAAARLGVHWYHTQPPVKEIEFEMDMRGVVQDIVLKLG